ncbi:LacI family DNA-binding transcriptional regulator [Algoriphagus aquimarinus]|uniref:Transcriptional regulator, LacI family n=1 Tax=Algoriphagus aquimarinus TaxID=237018 RepID=A0A1I0XRZ2_9BACT|nr:LacI family DNA-binding transcriptional regulator [Algoriphagus aquimarinus]SFB02733.1 transcriptional regulator, LacI family [Algoriphagus aquimarinus]|tara:strand:- start:312580 stop:313611 length:1032 start_codon:yes stop_codon:yes gene_type:complete
MKLGQATIKDIARELNLSASTISRALKDYHGISDETKRKVKEMAEKLNYRPNAIALSLRQSRSFTIGVIIPEVVHFFFSTVISGIEEIANSRGYNVILAQSNEKLAREISTIETMLSNQIDGVLVSYSKETKTFDHFTKLLDHGFPIVFFDRAPAIPGAINVMVDDYQGSFDATAHLISQGYKNIVHLAGPKTLKISIDREKGYKDALLKNGLDVNPAYIISCPLGTLEESKDLVSELLISLPDRPDAFFSCNDIGAVGAMMACRDAGLKIPLEVGIVGFSDWQFCSMLQPQLSSVAQPGFLMGARATEILIDIIEKKLDPKTMEQSLILETKLMERGSSKRF